MNDIFQTVNSIRERIANIDKKMNAAGSIREYDELEAKRALALADLEYALADLQRVVAAEREIQLDGLSEASRKRYDKMFTARISRIA
jgi:predicted  nucleic acid-binding Zn-ribbon protein